ncbi:unnamed protein product, partial [Didymodactylos carnosus]
VAIDENETQDFTGVWLDCTSEENKDFYISLKSIFKNLKSFNNSSKCITYISESEETQIFFIVSSTEGEHVIPLVHDELSQIVWIYVSCQNQMEYNHWLKEDYSKTRNRIFIDKNLLFEQLEKDILDQKRDDATPTTYKEALPSLSLFKKDEKNSTIRNLSKESVRFIHFQLLIDILLDMEESDTTKEIMLKECRRCYQNNNIELEKISKFDQEYKSDKAIWWYTCSSFLHRLLNKALGLQDPDYLFIFRYIISHLHNQLLKLHSSRTELIPSTVYRGKVLPSNIVQNLNDNVNGLVSINGFLSATTDKNVSHIFCAKGDTIPEGHERVCFKLKIGNNIANKPYAAIKELSAIRDEREILFSIGTVWRIISVNEDKDNQILIIELELSDEQNQNRLELTNSLRKQIGETSTLLTLGNFLSEIGDYERASGYYQMLLKQLPKYHEDRGKIYNNLGCIRYEQGDYHAAEIYFEKAIAITNINNNNNLSLVVAEYNKEMVHFDNIVSTTTLQSIELLTEALSIRGSSTSEIFNNQGLVYYKKREYALAINAYHQALENLLKFDPYPPHISAVYNNIGVVHFQTENYDCALINFQLAIESGLKFWRPEHDCIRRYLNNKAVVLRHKKTHNTTMSEKPKVEDLNVKIFDLDRRLSPCSIGNDLDSLLKLADKYCHNNMISDLAAIYNKIGSIYHKKQDYSLALSYYQKAIDIAVLEPEQHGIADYYANIGLVYAIHKKFESALENFNKALDIKRLNLIRYKDDIVRLLRYIHSIKLEYKGSSDILDD